MALINCPECGMTVSDKADQCPRCAYPFNPVETTTAQKKITEKIVIKSKEGCFLQTLNAGCVIVVAILGIIGLIFFVGLCSRLT